MDLGLNIEDYYSLSIEKLNFLLEEEKKQIDSIDDKISGIKLNFINYGIDGRDRLIRLKTVIRKKRKNVSLINRILTDKYIQKKKERIFYHDRLFAEVAKQFLSEEDFMNIANRVKIILNELKGE